MAEEAINHIKTGNAKLTPISTEEISKKMAKKASAPPVEQKSNTEVTEDGKLKVVDTKLPENKIEQKIDKDGKPVVEPKVDAEGKPIVAEPKLDAEGKPIVEEPKKQSLKEKLKPFSNKKATPTPEGELIIPDAVKGKLSEYEKRIAESESILSDPDVKAFLEIKKAGKSAIDIFKEAIGNQIDTSKMTDAQVYEHGLKMNGVKPADELEKGSEEPSLEEEMAKFKDMGKLAQKREADNIRKEIEQSNTGTTEAFLNKLISHNQTDQLAQNAQKQEEAKKIDQLQKEINDWADAYVGQEHLAVVGTPQMAESIKKFNIADLIFPKKEDGTLDGEKVARLIHYSLFGDLMFENLENQFFATGFNELKKDVEVTKGATQSLVRTPPSKPQRTEKEMVQEIHSKLRPVS